MYTSPIKTNVTCESTTLARKYDDAILTEVIHKVDVEVDKEELLKALRYDRDQYVKGFNDGVEYEKSHNITGKWIKEKIGDVDCLTCSVCGMTRNYLNRFNYCPNCGADMRGET